MTDLCAQCPQPHLYKTYVLVGGFPLWFCGPRCKNIWLVHDRPTSGKKLHLLILATIILTGVTFKAWGAPPENSPLMYRDWFASQMRPDTGTSCCDVSDGHIVDWNFKGDHYVAFFEGKWRDIPAEKVIQNSRNPTGSGVVWYTMNTGEPFVLCFAPSTGA